MKETDTKDKILPNNTSWHSSYADEALKNLQTNSNGLSSGEAADRLKRYGSNELTAEEKVSPLKLLLEQFKSLLIIILIAAAAVSASMGEMVEAIAIIIIVVLAGVLGFIQEYQAGKAIDSLKKMAAPHASVIRDNEEKVINSSDLVPGDIILIKTGDRIPADARIIEASNLKVEEASLTGESLPVDKIINPVDEESTIGDRKNMLYSGTSVSYGRGKAVVTETGMNTEFGKIARLLHSTENRKTPIQINLDQLGKKIGIFAIVLATVMSTVGYLRGHTIVEMFIWGVALAVAVIPEALPAVVTISLALGVRRMVKRRALIRKLPAVETLGATTIICSDKTGTLTQDEMTIQRIYTASSLYEVTGSGYLPRGEFRIDGRTVDLKDSRDLKYLLTSGILCNDTNIREVDGQWEVMGDPTEGAIVVAAAKAGLEIGTLRDQFPRIREIPFSSERKRMTTVHNLPQGYFAYSKGATEIILDSCSHYHLNGDIAELNEEARNQILEASYSMAKDALRVLAISYKNIDNEELPDEEIERAMVFLGLTGMMDPPRPEVKAAIKTCEIAGIKPIMITGDHKITAVAVAKELGILKEGGALSGVELEKLSEKEFEKTVSTTEVYARISPSHKLKIVEGLMKKGHIVAMTGDGVNDAPSLKRADIGVAMGITGTDVSKEASDMILTDDNFASIVAAVEEGRSIFQNIRKYLVFLLSGNMGTVFAMIFTLLAGLPLPLFAVQILFINFIMDGLMAIALGVEPPEPGIMEKKPRNVQEGILNKNALWYIGAVGFWIAVITSAIFTMALSYGYSEKDSMTMFFVTLIFARLFNGLNFRSLDQSIFKMGFFKNKALIYSSLAATLMTLAVLYVPALRVPFHTVPLTIEEWVAIILISSTVMIFVEIWKLIAGSRRKQT